MRLPIHSPGRRGAATPGTLAAIALAAAFAAAPALAQQTVVTFDDGWSGWNAQAKAITPEGGNPGPHIRTELEAFGLTVWTDSHEAFVGNLGGPDELSIGIDVKAEQLSGLNGPVERPLVVEFRSYALGADGMPWASVWYELGTLEGGQPWRTLSVSFDPGSTTLPSGWRGTGAEDPVTGELILPEGVTFADILAQTDEVAFSTTPPGSFSATVWFDVRFDNIFIGAAAAKVPQYEIVDLGTFGGELANAHDINDAGQVVGTAETADMNSLPFLWQDGKMESLGSVIPGMPDVHGVARGISENGIVAGQTMAPFPEGPGMVGHAFVWTAQDGMIDLTPDSSALSVAWDVNGSGQVVGEGPGGAFIWSKETGYQVIDYPNALFSSGMAEGINEDGLVVGHAFNQQEDIAGWVHDSRTGVTTELPHLENGPSVTRELNNAGDIVGASSLANNQGRPVMWTHDGEIVDLGFLPVPNYSTGYANDINEQRWIIGEDYFDGFGEPNKAWLWVEGSKYELKTLIADPAVAAEWDAITTPLGINNNGEIVGIGIHNGIPGRAFLMRPIAGGSDVIFAHGFESTPR